MHIVVLAIAILTVFAQAHAQSAATGVAKEVTRGPRNVPLSADALCAKLTLDEVTAIMGKNFEQRPHTLYPGCKYGDGKEKGKLQVRYFTLGNSSLKEANWRKVVESEGKGKVVERDGVLVSRLRGNKSGAVSIWFKDRQGHALELNVNSGVTEDQAVALAKSAID